MKVQNILFLLMFLFPCLANASKEGIPPYYKTTQNINSNRNAYSKYNQQGYNSYIGSSGQKQILSSKQYSYQIPKQKPITFNRNAATINGIDLPEENKTSIYLNYGRRFADFEFKTGVQSILEWDDMVFNEINAGVRHEFSIRNLDLFAFGEYTYGELSHGGLSMDYDLDPYDDAYPEEGIFTISMGGQSGNTHHIKFGLGAKHVWDIAGWKISPQIGYEIFKHNLKMKDHIYPNPAVYLPLMTSEGDYVFGDGDGNFYVIGQEDASQASNDNLYQVCMSPEDIKVVSSIVGGEQIVTTDWNESMGTLPWGVGAGNCVVIGGDGKIVVDGTTHIYNTTWSGFYVGLEIEKQLTLVDKLRMYVQVGKPKYSSEGTWPNRTDWQQNPSFLDEGNNGSISYEAQLEYTYKLSDRLQLALQVETNYFHVGKIPGELYVAGSTDFDYVYDEDSGETYVQLDEYGYPILVNYSPYTEHVSDSLEKATWQSFGLKLGLKYSF